jgi:hypothetical protein
MSRRRRPLTLSPGQLVTVDALTWRVRLTAGPWLVIERGGRSRRVHILDPSYTGII